MDLTDNIISSLSSSNYNLQQSIRNTQQEIDYSILDTLENKHVIKNENHQNIVFVFLSTLSALALIILIMKMVYCCLKRRNSYKSTPNNLASISTTNNSNFSSSLNNSLIESLNNTGISDSTTSSSSYSSSTSNSSSLTSNPNSNSILLQKSNSLKEYSIKLPIAKPTLNELKPQLSIETKMKTKTYESKSLYNKRRGSNNSLTLTINNPIKKKLPINTSNPPKECSTLEYLSKASRLLSIQELVDISKDSINLYNEFYFIPFNHCESNVSGSGIKNRYKTIIPNESTRVLLPVRNNDPTSTYINANYINGFKGERNAYIATQGPMSNTINDFWCMIWNERVTCCVMITKLIERNKNKCESYLPDKLFQPVAYDNNIVVTLNQINSFGDYEMRQLTVTCNNETRILYHFWYTTWPDHNLPDNPNALIQLIKQIETLQDYNMNNIKNGPLVVHCSAGVGRTGCFLALMIGIKQIDVENLVDVVQIVCRLRKDRGGMIQTIEQYEFVYQVLAYYCIYYKKYPLSVISMNCSPSISVSSPSPSSTCLQSSESSSFSFNMPTIQ